MRSPMRFRKHFSNSAASASGSKAAMTGAQSTGSSLVDLIRCRTGLARNIKDRRKQQIKSWLRINDQHSN